MAICIAYRGTLCDPSRVAELVTDARAFAALVGWRCKTMIELVAAGVVSVAGLDGVTLYPPVACEPIHFHFDREGTFVNHFYYALYANPQKVAMLRAATGDAATLTRSNWTKTQFAGAEVHAAVCVVLHHVKRRYAPDLEVDDDSGYFADQDYAKLESQLAQGDDPASLTSRAARAAHVSTGAMTTDSFLDRVSDALVAAKTKQP